MTGTRAVLIETAARLLAQRGPAGLTARGVASEAGVSTMGVYHHFGGMDELRRAVRDEGFQRLRATWADVARTRDPVADLTVAGVSYARFALTQPHLYRAMFFEPPAGESAPAVDVVAASEARVARCVEAGRFARVEPLAGAWQLWAATHGMVSGVLAGVVEWAVAPDHMRGLGLALYVGFGDQPAAAARSIARAQARVGPPQATLL